MTCVERFAVFQSSTRTRVTVASIDAPSALQSAVEYDPGSGQSSPTPVVMKSFGPPEQAPITGVPHAILRVREADRVWVGEGAGVSGSSEHSGFPESIEQKAEYKDPRGTSRECP